MGSGTTTLTEGEILSHAIETVEGSCWHQVAPILSRLKLPARDLDRVDQLLERGRAGEITDAEHGELEKYLRVGSFLDLMRARALRELGRAAQR